ncbi:MAG: CHAT domain-containing protein [Bryobacteraceae bacterium]
MRVGMTVTLARVFNAGRSETLKRTAGRRNQAVFPAYAMMLLLAIAPRVAQAPQVHKRPTTGPELLAEAKRLAFLHNWPTAAPLFTEAEKFYAKRHDQRGELYAHVGRLRGEVESRSLPEVSDYLASVLKSTILEADPQLRLFCLIAKGDIDFQIDPKSSEVVWAEVAKLAAELGDGTWENRARAELGTIAFYKGEIYRAARLVVQSYSVAELKGDVAYLIRLRAALGEGFAEFGHPKDALKFFDNALAMAKSNPDAGFPFTAYLGKGRALIALGRTAEGEAILRASLDDAQRNRMKVREARILLALGDLTKAQGKPIEARSCFERAARLAQEQRLQRLTATATARLASLSLDQSLADAERFSRESIQSTFAGRDAFHLPRVLATSAEVEFKRGNVYGAERDYRLASQLVDRLLTNVTPFEQKDFLLASMSPIYLGHARLALKMHNPASAFEALEHGYARGIAESLRTDQERDRLALALTPEAARRVNSLQITLLHEQQSSRRSEILSAIWETEKRGIIIHDSDKIPFGADSAPVPVRQLQRVLRPDELLLEYALDEPSSILLVVDQHSIEAYDLPPRHELNGLIQNYLTTIDTTERGVAAGLRLGAVLLGPVWKRPEKRFVVVGHERLQTVPFDALLLPNRHYLAETHIVTYSPSATILAELRSTAESHCSRRLLGVGAVRYSGGGVPGVLYALTRGVGIGLGGGVFDSGAAPSFGPLPGSRRELLAAAAAIPGSTLLLDSAATEEKVKSEPLDSYGVLHFAVHVAVDDEHPDRTALVLSDGPRSTEDGLLQAREIAHLRLQAKLVVLSGCNTGSPIFQSSFDNASLVRSFLFAGAKSVVATLWNIDDTFTAYLMGQFYGYLRQGADGGTALAQAKRDAIRRYGDSGPSLWAGFRLIGNGYESIN